MTSGDPGLAEVLSVATPPLVAVLCVPLRRTRLHAVALLYFGREDSRPGPRLIEHLTAMARPVAVALEAALPRGRA